MSAAAVTQDALRAAWTAMRLRPSLRHWPQEFDLVMADPLRGRLVGLEARHCLGKPSASPGIPAPRRPAAMQQLSTPPAFDHKRAAAGDRDD